MSYNVCKLVDPFLSSTDTWAGVFEWHGLEFNVRLVATDISPRWRAIITYSWQLGGHYQQLGVGHTYPFCYISLPLAGLY